jgi:hypothetical protein
MAAMTWPCRPAPHQTWAASCSIGTLTQTKDEEEEGKRKNGEMDDDEMKNETTI